MSSFHIVLLALAAFAWQGGAQTNPDAAFYNPPPAAPPAELPRLQYVSRIADQEIRRIENTVLTLRASFRLFSFFGKVDCTCALLAWLEMVSGSPGFLYWCCSSLHLLFSEVLLL